MSTYRVTIPLKGLMTVIVDADSIDDAHTAVDDLDLADLISGLYQDSAPGRAGFDADLDCLDLDNATAALAPQARS